MGAHLSDLAQARDESPVVPGGPAKSISVEETFPADLSGRPALEAELLGLADRLASRLRRSGVAARTVALKVRFGDFSAINRSRTFPEPLDTAHDLYRAGLALLDRAAVGKRPVRLLGLGGEGLSPAGSSGQLGLEPRPWSELEAAVDRVRDRFGSDAVAPARLVGRRSGLRGALPE